MKANSVSPSLVTRAATVHDPAHASLAPLIYPVVTRRYLRILLRNVLTMQKRTLLRLETSARGHIVAVVSSPAAVGGLPKNAGTLHPPTNLPRRSARATRRIVERVELDFVDIEFRSKLKRAGHGVRAMSSAHAKPNAGGKQ